MNENIEPSGLTIGQIWSRLTPAHGWKLLATVLALPLISGSIVWNYAAIRSDLAVSKSEIDAKEKLIAERDVFSKQLDALKKHHEADLLGITTKSNTLEAQIALHVAALSKADHDCKIAAKVYALEKVSAASDAQEKQFKKERRISELELLLTDRESKIERILADRDSSMAKTWLEVQKERERLNSDRRLFEILQDDFKLKESKLKEKERNLEREYAEKIANEKKVYLTKEQEKYNKELEDMIAKWNYDAAKSRFDPAPIDLVEIVRVPTTQRKTIPKPNDLEGKQTPSYNDKTPFKREFKIK